jgi:hypothetical protein
MAEVSTFDKERESLKTVITSECFSRAPQLAKLLTYLCEKYFEGRSAELKEYSIAVEGLGRPADHDDTGSAAARVQMHRLRNKLNEYYEHDGINDPVRIVLKPGVYTPQFVEVDALANVTPAPPSTPPGSPHTVSTDDKIRHLWWSFGGLGVALAVAALVFVFGRWHHDAVPPSEQPGLAPASSSPPRFFARVSPATLQVSPEKAIRILAGSDKPSVVDALGNIWQGDRYFQGGEAEVTPSAFLGLTSDPALFQTFRRGDFTYKIPLAPGSYELHLYFADFLGPRRDLQTKKVLRDFLLIINEAAQWNHQSRLLSYGTRPPLETEKILKDVTPNKNGYLSLHFIPLLNFAFVNAILIIPTPDHKASPIRIVAQEKPVTDQHGQIWNSDRFYTDGNLVVHGTPITGTSDPELLVGERYGNFEYIVPVADSSFTVTLYFVETWLGKEGPGGGGIGTRVFQVALNDDRVLRHFDVLAESGGTGRVLVKTFHGITPDEDGHIVLSFIPIENSALINAIEITDEGAGATHSNAGR